MSITIVIAAPDQTTGNELRTLVEELDDVVIIDVADSTTRLETLVATRDPEIALVHEGIGPVPVLQTVRDLNVRRPRTALLLVARDVTPELLTGAMDAGARGVLTHLPSLEELSTRVSATAQWVGQMRKHLVAGHNASDDVIGRGTLVAVAGAKGGVGTTTVATHLAHNAVTRVPGHSVCLVDLDLEKGDIATLLGITHRLDVSDLAKVSDDLTSQTLNSSIHRDDSGLSTIVSPVRLEDVGAVTERETLLILAALRRQFDLVIVDVGSHVTPATAAVVESATEALIVTTSDVLSLRGVHRMIESWQRFGTREPQNVKVLINKLGRDNDIQFDTAGRLLPVKPLDTVLVDAPRILERGVNHQSPRQITSREWWHLIDQVASEIGIASGGSSAVKAKPSLRSGLRRRSAAESGQATVEFTGLLWLIALLIVVVWQVALWGVAAAFTGHAADEAARVASLGGSAAEVEAAGMEAVPAWLASDIQVRSSSDVVTVRAALPILSPGLSMDRLAFTSRVEVVSE